MLKLNDKINRINLANCNKYESIIPKLVLIVFIILELLKPALTCDIVGASACMHKPDNDLKEENIDEYCSKYKQHLECVYKKYKGCEKGKYSDAMESMVKGLRKKAKQIEALCEIDIDIPSDQPAAKPANTEGGSRGNERPTTRRSTTTGLPCRINSISPDCHQLLTNVQFNPQWNGVMKQKWCNSANSYYQCIKTRLVNCIGVQYIESVGYYEKIQKYVNSQSNINCPGGLEGCAANPNDVRCKMGVKYGETSSGSFVSSKNFNYFTHYYCLLFIVLIYFRGSS